MFRPVHEQSRMTATAAAGCLLLALSSIAHAQEKANDEYPAHSPDEIAALVAQRPAGVKLTASVPIAKVDFGKKGKAHGHVFVDSMEDYRDPKSVNVNVFPHAAQRLKFVEGMALVGRTITVHGVARRVLIRCHAGCPQDSSAKRYFQTQIFVRDGDDAEIDQAAEE